MTTNKTIRQELLKKIPQSTMYLRMKVIKAKTTNSISNKVALNVVASQENIDVYKILQKEKQYEDLENFKNAVSRFDFDNGSASIKQTVSQTKRNVKVERSPYDLPLSRYDIDAELMADCKIQKPYRKAVSEALLTLETRIRSHLCLSDTLTGAALIAEAKKADIFKRTVKAEEEGLFFIFMGAFKWLRNPSGHRKVEYSKQDAVIIVLFTDYLLRLFNDLKNKSLDTARS